MIQWEVAMALFRILVVVALPLTLGALPQTVWAENQSVTAPRGEASVQRLRPEHHHALRSTKEMKEILAASYMSYYWDHQASSKESMQAAASTMPADRRDAAKE
jgi:hypothetical protein